jgi:nucleotide-binding universal stress UspA family protein
MYRSILVPLDGTAVAQHALLPAADIARRTRGRLVLAVVHPIGPAEDAPAIGSRRADVRALATRERSEGQRTVLGSVADELVRTSPLPVLVCHAAPAVQVATLTGGR